MSPKQEGERKFKVEEGDGKLIKFTATFQEAIVERDKAKGRGHHAFIASGPDLTSADPEWHSDWAKDDRRLPEDARDPRAPTEGEREAVGKIAQEGKYAGAIRDFIGEIRTLMEGAQFVRVGMRVCFMTHIPWP